MSGFERFCERIGLHLEPFQRRIAKAATGPEHELVVLLPRGNGKTTLLAALALWHLVVVKGAAVYCAAASRDQARILFESAADFARRLDDPHLIVRHLELRWADDPDEPKVFSRHLRVLAADAPRLHGLTPSLAIVDELHAHPDDEVYAETPWLPHRHDQHGSSRTGDPARTAPRPRPRPPPRQTPRIADRRPRPRTPAPRVGRPGGRRRRRPGGCQSRQPRRLAHPRGARPATARRPRPRLPALPLQPVGWPRRRLAPGRRLASLRRRAHVRGRRADLDRCRRRRRTRRNRRRLDQPQAPPRLLDRPR
jgi:hypothetical protein